MKDAILLFGFPEKIAIDGVEEPRNEICECIQALDKHSEEILRWTISKVNGVTKLYVVTGGCE